MQKAMRDIITLVRASGGSDVWVSQGGRHTRVHFTTPAGRQTLLIIHRGNRVSSRYVAMIRSRLRREQGK
jgi:hypothetical protein